MNWWQLIASGPKSSHIPYEVRLQRALDGEGPTTVGLSEFVKCLEQGSAREMFGVSLEGIFGVGLLDSAGELAAITLVCS